MINLVEVLRNRFKLFIFNVSAMLAKALRQLLACFTNVLLTASLANNAVYKVATGATELVCDRPRLIGKGYGSVGVNELACFALWAITCVCARV